MSAGSVSISRKRPYSPNLRDNGTDTDVNLQQKKKRTDAELPEALKSKLQQITDWFFELKHVNTFAKMAFKCGATVLTASHQTHRGHDSSDDDDDEDDIVIDLDDDDEDDEIQEITENGNQEKLPLANGSSFHGSLYSSNRHNGFPIRDLSTRYHGKNNCPLERKPLGTLKPKPLVSNPATEIEVAFGDEPEVVDIEGDGIEILSESPSSNQKSAKSKKSLGNSVKSSKKASAAVKQAQSAPVKRYLSSSKFYTAKEVVRLQEKEQYKLLLEKYICETKQRQALASESVKEVKEDSREFSGRHFRKHVLEQPLASFFEKYYKPCQLLPPKSEKPSEKKNEPTEITIDDEEDEVEVIEMKQINYKSVFNSHLFSKSWLSELQQNVCKQTKETNKVVEDYERQLEKYKTERLLRQLKLEDPESQIIDTEFPDLSPEMEEMIDKLLCSGAPGDLINRTDNSELMRKDLDTLVGLHWLNDTVINSYFDLIIERSKEEGYPSVFAFNTFFYSTLKNKGYSAVRRWTRKKDIFSYDIVFVPIHLTYHWCLGVIDNRQKKICYYDSMGTGEEECLFAFQDYLCSEHKDKKNKDLNPSTYTLEIMREIPQQQNGSDCGMFTVKYAEYISRNAEITFNQTHMQYFRRRAIYELVHRQIL